MNDYYIILELSLGATKDEIKMAYRRLSKKYHPDMNGGSKASEEKFKQVKEAYDALYNDDGYNDQYNTGDYPYAGNASSNSQNSQSQSGSRTTYVHQSTFDFHTLRSLVVILVAAVKLIASFSNSSSFTSNAPRVNYYSSINEMPPVEQEGLAQLDTVYCKAKKQHKHK